MPPTPNTNKRNLKRGILLLKSRSGSQLGNIDVVDRENATDAQAITEKPLIEADNLNTSVSHILTPFIEETEQTTFLTDESEEENDSAMPEVTVPKPGEGSPSNHQRSAALKNISEPREEGNLLDDRFNKSMMPKEQEGSRFVEFREQPSCIVQDLSKSASNQKQGCIKLPKTLYSSPPPFFLS